MIIGILGKPLVGISFPKIMAEGIEYLSKTDFTKIDSGTYHIQGKDLFFIINEYETKLQSNRVLESHKQYIDIHSVIVGSEKIAYTPFIDQMIVKEYDDKEDYVLYEGDSSLIKMGLGTFAIFFPDDLHASGIGDESHKIKKVVMKVRIGL
jgi:YhcH/YjgK/YiaL family protein